MKNVLIVDDVKSWREFNSQVIKDLYGEDVTITTAASASDAYDILLTNKDFDIIITDLQMENNYSPKHAGEWLVEQIKTFDKYKKTKIIMISASYNLRQIARNLDIECIPKSTALASISAFKEILNV